MATLRFTSALIGFALLGPALAAQQSIPTFTVAEQLDVKEPHLADISADGKWVAVITSWPRRHLGPTLQRFWGDPTRPFSYRPEPGALTVIDTRTGAVTAPLPPDRNVLEARWSPDGTRLAIIVEQGEEWRPMVWELSTKQSTEVPIPANHLLAGGDQLSRLLWTPDGKGVILMLRTRAWQQELRRRFDSLVSGEIVLMSSSEPFLPWEAMDREKGRYSAVVYRLDTKRHEDLLPVGYYGAWSPPAVSRDGLRLSFEVDTTSRTQYGGGAWKSNKRSLIPFPASGEKRALAERQIALELAREVTLEWSSDGQRYAYAKKGRLFAGTLGGSERQIAGPPADTSKSPTSATNGVPTKGPPPETFTLVRLAESGDWLLASNGQDISEFDAKTGARTPIAPGDTGPMATQYTFIAEAPGGAMILAGSSRTEWKSGVYKYQRGGRVRPLLEDRRRYGMYTPDVKASDDGSTIVFVAAEGSVPGDVYSMDAEGKNVRRLTHANPKFDDPRTRRTELFGFRDADGRRQHGVIYYPFDYVSGKAYPTIVHPYEGFFKDEYEPTDKTLNAAGYLVVRPSVPTRHHPGYPAEAWMKGVSIALNELIDRGLADSARIGVYGCSYGGYATNLLITQSPRFKAAVNIAGLADLISMYFDSPRLGLRNMYFSESSTAQFPMTGTLWQEPQKYVQNSPIFYFDRVTAPVLIITGSEDHNVIPGQQQEAFYALRRLGKTVDWVTYRNMGHCGPYASQAIVEDFHKRIVGWFDKYVKP